MFPTVTVELHKNGKPVRIHLVSTGAVSVKRKFRDATKTGVWAMIDFIRDKNFTEWMPIWVMVVEHPERIFVIDTGENADVNNPGYFKSSGFFANWFDTTQFKFEVKPDEEIGPQLERLHVSNDTIKSVILTHLHLDHIDGLKYFPKNDILVNKHEWEKPFGDLPKLYPTWFKPTLVELNERYDVFNKAYYLTEAKDMILVDTPGHTYGHCSVIINCDEGCVFFAADICYSEEQLLDERYSGANAKHALAQSTYGKVKAFAKDHKVIFIPSHDAAAAERLQHMIPLF